MLEENDDPPPHTHLHIKKMKKKSQTSLKRSKPQPSSYDLSERLAASSPQAEFLRWHYMLRHVSFAKLKLMAALGILSRKLATVKPPKCT
jgi:hypothetical protein